MTAFKFQTLNVLQKLRGIKMPGYVSLFEAESRQGERRRRATRPERPAAMARRNSSPGVDSLEGIIDDLSQHEEMTSRSGEPSDKFNLVFRAPSRGLPRFL